MKRVLCVLTVIILCLAIASPVFAAKTEFVPSISYKDHPPVVPVPPKPGDERPEDKVVVGEIVDKEKDEVVDDIYEEFLVVTPVADAETSTDIPQDSKDQLIEIYEKLTDGTMEIPYDKIDPNIDPNNMVVRDLFDVSTTNEDHEKVVAQDNMSIRVTFDLGVAGGVDVYCMTYINGEWVPAISVMNNGDGTVTVTMESFGVVAFSVETSGTVTPPPQTGDQVGSTLPIWIAVMAVAAVGLVVVLVLGNRKKQ